MRILIVEDEADLVAVLARGLRRAGYAVDVALDAEAALLKLDEVEYDLVTLDVNLPGADGWAILDHLGTERATTRVLMLTGRDDLPDRVRGLDGGADDYLVKPFEPAELHARIRALLRREPAPAGTVVEIGDLIIDRSGMQVSRGGADIALTAKEFRVLDYLAARPGTVVSSEELLEHVWDENADPFTATVKVTVSNLRRKLGPGAPIETVRGAGYRLVA